MANANELDEAVESAIDALEQLIVETEYLEAQQVLFPNEIIRNDPPENYREQIFNYTQSIRDMQLLKVQHKFLKIGDAERDRRLARQEVAEGNVQPDIETFKHTVRPFDTFESLALLFGVDWKEMARHNDILPKDLTSGTIIEIPLKIQPDEQPIADNPVFDSHIGQKALGHDLPNKLTVDSAGDLEELNNRNTFLQGVANIVTTEKGEFIESPDFGFNPGVGEDVPTILSEAWMKKDLQAALRQDARILGVPLSEITVIKDGESMTFTLQVEAIRTVGYEEVTVTR